MEEQGWGRNLDGVVKIADDRVKGGDICVELYKGTFHPSRHYFNLDIVGQIKNPIPPAARQVESDWRRTKEQFPIGLFLPTV